MNFICKMTNAILSTENAEIIASYKSKPDLYVEVKEKVAEKTKTATRKSKTTDK